MRVIIAGSKNITDFDHLINALNAASTHDIQVDEVVSGGARGVDALGEEYAEDMVIPLHIYPAWWSYYGKRAGYIRNKQMAEFADALIAIWDGESKGTKNMIDLAKKHKLKVYVHLI